MGHMTEEELEARRRRRRKRKQAQREKRNKAALLAGREVINGRRTRAAEANRCRALTRSAGMPCPMFRAVLEDPETGKLYRAATCYAHLPEKIRERFGKKPFGGKVEGTGGARLTKPKVPEILREMFEQEVTEWLKPYFEALSSMKPVVVGNGRHARVELLPDYRTRLQASEAIQDRLYGKAKQTTELTGADGGPVEVEVPQNKERALEVAKILAEAGAVDPKAAAKKTAKAVVAAAAAERN